MEELFEFGDGTVVEIVEHDVGFAVRVVDVDLDEFEVSGFPTKKDAHTFVMFGDFDRPKDNDYIRCVKPSFKLEWKF